VVLCSSLRRALAVPAASLATIEELQDWAYTGKPLVPLRWLSRRRLGGPEIAEALARRRSL
jgi:hypothetical protein